jgi:hypothetical protein
VVRRPLDIHHATKPLGCFVDGSTKAFHGDDEFLQVGDRETVAGLNPIGKFSFVLGKTQSRIFSLQVDGASGVAGHANLDEFVEPAGPVHNSLVQSLRIVGCSHEDHVVNLEFTVQKSQELMLSVLFYDGINILQDNDSGSSGFDIPKKV